MALLKRNCEDSNIRAKKKKGDKSFNEFCKTEEDIESMIIVHPIKSKHNSGIQPNRAKPSSPDSNDHSYATSQSTSHIKRASTEILKTILQNENKQGRKYENKLVDPVKNDSTARLKPNILKKKDEACVQTTQSIFLTKVDPKNVPSEIKNNFHAVKSEVNLNIPVQKTIQISPKDITGSNDGLPILAQIAQIDSNNTLFILQNPNNKLLTRKSLNDESSTKLNEIPKNSVLQTKISSFSEGSNFSSQNGTSISRVSTVGSTCSSLDISQKKVDIRPSTTNPYYDGRKKIEFHLNSNLPAFSPSVEESDEEEGITEDVGLASIDELTQFWEFCVDLHNHNERVIYRLKKNKYSYMRKIKKFEKYLSKELGSQFQSLQDVKNTPEMEIELTQSNNDTNNLMKVEDL